MTVNLSSSRLFSIKSVHSMPPEFSVIIGHRLKHESDCSAKFSFFVYRVKYLISYSL